MGRRDTPRLAGREKPGKPLEMFRQRGCSADYVAALDFGIEDIMAIDLFGNTIEEKALTATQRISTRQSPIRGRDLYTIEPLDIDRFVKTIQKDHVELLSPIWEPAAGYGDISKTLIKYGYDVISTDIFAYRDDAINTAIQSIKNSC